MLISSDRHTPQDLQAWESLERYDHRLYPAAEAKAEHAIEVIRRFADTGDCYLSTSWGKDSTVLVDLAGRAGVNIPIVSLVIDGYELPGTTQVRDAMLSRHPHLDYHELVLPPQPNRWWDTTTVKRTKHDADIGWRLIEKRFGPRHITGIRAEESRIRTLVQHRFGDATERTARPIGTWAATDIFAYLAGHNLPVHPAYAMSHGGTLDRRWLRVHALGGVTGADKGRADWEESYFGDVIRSSRLRDTLMQELPGNRHDALSASVIAAQSEIPISDAQQALE
ncbi:phosphoadenosine phosphosulfate reductase family protein [Corynebacterium accolens]|uniref:phosphoadenosine phosphosulfate reductase domain-containing protein n=1 Tax=Corynebacterium accolens TaxID=38284 RepID=UPI00254B1284|nr:phosphoadenosine phosphosulfate reductase family protein [Corynebacterium accolens]MDK8505547.1 phosphoadenosine phosphosulfate reductase family protein [Corynebacterium accolens]MDK8662397.1 phosphoadenosine phosphosulfate reductase family protein [Corynebacterium accolens]